MRPDPPETALHTSTEVARSDLRRLEVLGQMSVGAVAPVSGSEGCPGFAEALIVEDDSATGPAAGAALVIELLRGRCITIFPSASPALAVAALKALR